MAAAMRGHTEVVAQLLEAGANTDLQQKVTLLPGDISINTIYSSR